MTQPWQNSMPLDGLGTCAHGKLSARLRLRLRLRLSAVVVPHLPEDAFEAVQARGDVSVAAESAGEWRVLGVEREPHTRRLGDGDHALVDCGAAAG